MENNMTTVNSTERGPRAIEDRVGRGGANPASEFVAAGGKGAIAGSATTKRSPELIAAEIRALTGQVLSAFLEIGRRFVEAKELLPHGEFGAWVREQTG